MAAQSKLRTVLSRLLFIGGACLLAEGGFSVYPFLFAPERTGSPPERGIQAAVNGPATPGTFVFRLSLPRQHADFDVVEGTSDQALRMGPGHMSTSAMPGRSGNVVVAGHRDTHFRVLKDIAVGDEIRLDERDKTFVYRIVETRVVSPRDTSVLRPGPRKTLTLVTCYPFTYIGRAPKRFIVRAREEEQ